MVVPPCRGASRSGTSPTGHRGASDRGSQELGPDGSGLEFDEPLDDAPAVWSPVDVVAQGDDAVLGVGAGSL